MSSSVWFHKALMSCYRSSELPEYVEHYMKSEFPLKDFITHTMSLDLISIYTLTIR